MVCAEARQVWQTPGYPAVMRGTWITRPGQLVVVGVFGDIEVHHHPAVQLAVGLDGPLAVSSGDGTTQRCRIAVMAGGAKHALHTAGANSVLSIYVGPETATAATMNAASRGSGAAPGVWAVDGADAAAAGAAAAVSTGDLAGAADLVVGHLLERAAGQRAVELHPQVPEAIAVVSARLPGSADLGSVAEQVALSPDYLGRLFRQQTGASFAATARWTRLLVALDELSHGASITDAAHAAGFSDGAHAARVCRELTGIAPRDVARALRPR
ncbi:hypothetical protein BTO20_21190 [Mycobacterium dioxanotrophicus]|uniref:HTH araC/xylS-type domain-containing protein n=2 Tax=Mycobacterium dioxanotrophicus TaxID=482462 RepID=A0A1Y0C6P3_9MYCO|nr:hypothetical protein BTO20_21190 [Mycobacterium dioxanotrophicus]